MSYLSFVPAVLIDVMCPKAKHCISSVLSNRRLVWLTSDIIVSVNTASKFFSFIRKQFCSARGAHHRKVGSIIVTFQRDNAIYYISLFPT
jgi:hypothetical protein